MNHKILGYKDIVVELLKHKLRKEHSMSEVNAMFPRIKSDAQRAEYLKMVEQTVEAIKADIDAQSKEKDKSDE